MFILLLPLIIMVSQAATPDSRPEWVHLARQLIGETKGVREDALKKLHEKFHNLEDLTDELSGSYRAYALDVIVAMKLPGSVERLLQVLNSDVDGALTLAVNALVDGSNHNLIAKHYTRLMQDRPLGEIRAPVILAMVDFLTHLRRPCPEGIMTALLAHPRIEVQQAAALHLAVVPVPDQQQIIDTNLPKLFPQVRAQLMLTLFDNKELERAGAICRQDQDPILQSACEGLTFKKPKKSEKQKRKAKK